MTPFIVFARCVEAMRQGSLIRRVSKKDKEYHFQNWFNARLRETRLRFDIGGRNSYPDFHMVETTEGYELKGLAYPGREASFDSNSRVPAGFHNGRTIYYVFGRYPEKPDGNSYPVLDLVICHGDFLNADHEYKHKNKSVKGFGSYGDILIRDRKMYVVPTPFRLVDGAAHRQTLILPGDVKADSDFFEVGELRGARRPIWSSATRSIFGPNDLVPTKVPNPGAGREHTFRAWRLNGASADRVSMRDIPATNVLLAEAEDESGEE